MTNPSPNGSGPYPPRAVTLDAIPLIYALYRDAELNDFGDEPDEDPIAGWAFGLPSGTGIITIGDGNGIITTRDVVRSGRRAARIHGAELVVAQVRWRGSAPN